MSNTPVVKFEPSPADSLIDSFSSNSNTQYTSLFSEHQVLTPQSFDDESMFEEDRLVPMSPSEEDKKPVKKRKSWGQQLPEPKTNLPPRKRAKTEDEKEQRRVERVLRNRRAAQSSRERKRQEVEALEAEKMAIEQRNRELEARLAEAEANNLRLLQQLQQATGGKMRVFQGSSAVSSPVAEQLRAATPVTFSQELFSSQEEHQSPISTQSVSESRTVNPASLSPSLRPAAVPSNASTSDMTQHPAVSVGSTTALDELAYSTNLSGDLLAQHDINSYFNAPESDLTDPNIFGNGILPASDNFNINFDNLDGHNDSVFDDFILDDFLHQHEDQPTLETQCADELTEKTSILQPPFGASSYGCDDGGNAVSV